MDVHLRVYFPEFQTVFNGVAAANPRAVSSVLLPAAHALDHDYAARMDNVSFPLGYLCSSSSWVMTRSSSP